MEVKHRFVLRHKESGQYWDQLTGLTTHLWRSRRFPDREFIEVWLDNSVYAPKNREDFEVVPVQMTIEVILE